MSKKVPITLACGDYEIVRALKEGIVKPDGIDLTVVTEMDSTSRHWRFLRNREFDMAEVSCSSYMLARDNDFPIQAIPVFLHRRFRHGFVFINAKSGIVSPKDLIGKKIGVKSFQATAILWLRGILEHEYGVPHKSIEWYSELDEDVDFEPPADLKLTRLDHSQSIETMLLNGELDAILHTDLIKALVERDPRVTRLFPNYKNDEIDYFKRTGIFPIMHVMGIKQEILDRHPWVAINMYQAFEQSKAIGMARMENPRNVPLAWYREAWEEQEEILGGDPWEYGLTDANRHTLDTLAGYSFEQGLIRSKPALDDLFVDVSQGRKRGDVYRI